MFVPGFAVPISVLGLGLDFLHAPAYAPTVHTERATLRAWNPNVPVEEADYGVEEAFHGVGRVVYVRP